MNNILNLGPLLDEKGNLIQAGYSNQLVKSYKRKNIKVNKLKIKEWDYYYIGDENFGLALTIADNGYVGFAGFSIMDFNKKTAINKSKLSWFPLGKSNLPSSSINGDCIKMGKGYNFTFLNDNSRRHIIVCMTIDNKVFDADIKLELTSPNSMVIATPFKKKKHFYYNQKINLLLANGYFRYGDIYYEFNNKFGVLDWGRGVWTYKNTWYWASCSGEYNNHLIGFNLGYGFGDTSSASENMVFYDQQYYKLDDVKFNIPVDGNGKEDYLKPWTITSQNKDIDLKFEPILNRHENINAIVLQMNANQIFGKFSGYFRVDDKNIYFENLYGFAEKVKNRW